ncbi:serine hydrolase domain-containing protein [Massilia sp. R2A-15]|uniref:serine hydrolase domain-containing protein n=1 Tax=Massilia sp. R2A-15 TaxID=3064278 RepID=UPI002736857F|nr:serine hydrolase domain-containing protein [Massilia sp. R2A-15]WLI89126.1 serine hydrolase domain-containing protein [Massilia sp. R2A-15]
MKHTRRTLLGLALMGGMSHLLRAAPLAGNPIAGNPFGALDRELSDIAGDPACQMASLSVLAIRAGKPVYQRQFGHRFLATAAAPSRPADERTMYRIASISKMMTTLGLMRLVEDGKVALDADVSAHLGFTLRNPNFPDQPVTLRTLLTHTSSLRDEAGYFWPLDTALSSAITPGAWAKNAGPGQYFNYCNLNWGVIGTLMERVTGERFDRLMKRLLLDPMGLHGGYNPSEFSPEDLANVATIYRKRTTDTEVWDSAGPWIAQVDDYSTRAPTPPAGIERYVPGTNATSFSPTGGLRISARDMGRVMQMMMNGGAIDGRRILKPATLSAMFERQWTFDGKNGDTYRGLFNCWGLGNQQFPDQAGIALVDGGGFAGLGHHGDAYGLVSTFVFDPATKNGMVVLVGGTSADPETRRGAHSSMARFEERVLTALYRGAILGLSN